MTKYGPALDYFHQVLLSPPAAVSLVLRRERRHNVTRIVGTSPANTVVAKKMLLIKAHLVTLASVEEKQSKEPHWRYWR